MKICPVGAELFDVDGKKNRWTDMIKLEVAFRKFANAYKGCTGNTLHVLLSLHLLF